MGLSSWMKPKNPMQSGSGQELPPEDDTGDADDTGAMLDELDKASAGGDEFAAKEFFKTPEGVEPDPNAPAPPADPSMGIDPAALMQLLELLKQKQAEGGDVTDVSAPPIPG